MLENRLEQVHKEGVAAVFRRCDDCGKGVVTFTVLTFTVLIPDPGEEGLEIVFVFLLFFAYLFLPLFIFIILRCRRASSSEKAPQRMDRLNDLPIEGLRGNKVVLID
jgi:hypothetical protein